MTERAVAVTVTERVENRFESVSPPPHPNCKIFIKNYELIEENIWLAYVSVIFFWRENVMSSLFFFFFYENIINPLVINLVQKLTALLSNQANN